MLDKNEYNPYYERYISKVDTHADVVDMFQKGKVMVVQFFKKISQEKSNYRYAAHKWSVKEVLQHIIDTERIFIYRCFRIGREDKTPMEGFDQDQYMLPSGASDKTIDELINEYVALRESSISLLSSLTQDNLRNIGCANSDMISARACAFIILGHEICHLDVISERYL